MAHLDVEEQGEKAEANSSKTGSGIGEVNRVNNDTRT